MEKDIRVIYKKPGQPAELLVIPNELRAFQRMVGGYIEAVRATEDLVLLVNEDGQLTGLEPNICGLVGPIIAVGIDGDEFADVPDAAADLFWINAEEVRP